MLRRDSFVFTRPMNSSISLGLFPEAWMRVGWGMRVGISCSLSHPLQLLHHQLPNLVITEHPIRPLRVRAMHFQHTVINRQLHRRLVLDVFELDLPVPVADGLFAEVVLADHAKSDVQAM